MAALNSDQKLKLMIMKMLKERGSPSVRDMEAEGLDDVEIPPEHEEVLSGLAKLFGCADKDFLTLADLREFVSVNSRYLVACRALHPKVLAILSSRKYFWRRKEWWTKGVS